MAHKPIGDPPHRDVNGSRAWQEYNAGLSRAISSLQNAYDLFAQTAISDAASSTVTVTSADVSAISSPDGSTVTGTGTASGIGFASFPEFSNAITDINTTKTLANELKTNIATVRTLVNELKSDLNTLSTDLNAAVTNQNALIAALRDAGIIT